MDDKKEKWKVLSTEEVYKDPWIKVRVDKIRRPNGLDGTYSVVSIKGGIGVVPIDGDGKIHLVGQYRYTTDSYSWEIPQGAFTNFEHTDDPLSTAKRELEEETGIEAKNWEKLALIHTLLGSTNDVVHLFLARGLSFRQAHPDDTETIKTKKVTFEEFYEMMRNGKITDAASISAVLLAEKYLKNS